jgi:hypothetical protein
MDIFKQVSALAQSGSRNWFRLAFLASCLVFAYTFGSVVKSMLLPWIGALLLFLLINIAAGFTVPSFLVVAPASFALLFVITLISKLVWGK